MAVYQATEDFEVMVDRGDRYDFAFYGDEATAQAAYVAACAETDAHVALIRRLHFSPANTPIRTTIKRQ